MKKERFHLHQYKYLWKKCADPAIIIKAWLKLRKGKTKRKEVIEIESNFDYYLKRMIQTMSNTYPGGNEELSFHPKKYEKRMLFEHGKKRYYYAPTIWEQWVHHIVVQVLAPIIIKFSYRYSCGSMPKRGGVYGKNALSRVIKKRGFKYFVKLDIRHFFDSTKLSFVIKDLKTFINDDWFFYLLDRIFLYFPDKLPLGFYISQWLANFMLCRLDYEVLKRRPIFYIRYVDDMVICDNNKRFLFNLIEIIIKTLKKIHLKIKSNYQLCRFSYIKKTGKRIGRNIDFMGFVFTRHNVLIRKKILKNIIRLTNRLSKLDSIAVHQAMSILSRLGWFKHTDTDNFKDQSIKPCLNIRSLKNIIRRTDLYEQYMDRRDIISISRKVRAA